MASVSYRSSFLRKYRSALVLVVLFILCNIGIYWFNSHLSNLISKDTEAAHLATEQGIEVQKMTKALINIESQLNKLSQEKANITVSSQSIQNSLHELKQSVRDYDTTLHAFNKGGKVFSNTDRAVEVKPVSNQMAQKSLQRSISIWRPYKRLIDNFLWSVDNGSMNAASVAFAADYARLFSDDLFEETNALAYELHQQTQEKATLMKDALIPNAIITSLLFLLVVYLSLRRCMKTGEALDDALKETDEILETVKEGILLVDSHLIIRKYSATLHNILEGHQFVGLSLNTLLKDIVPENEIGISETFTEQLFQTSTDEGILDHINPLKRVMIDVADQNGNYQPHYFSFVFSRLYEEERIKRVLVSIRDITQAVELEKHQLTARKKKQAADSAGFTDTADTCGCM